MSTTADLLVKLNAMRADLNKPPLKAWKESRAKLLAVLDVTRDAWEQHSVFNQPVAETAPTPPVNVVAVNGAPVPTIKLADIARECGINPKVARAKMRRSGRWQAFGKHAYAAQHKEEIVAFLKSRTPL